MAQLHRLRLICLLPGLLVAIACNEIGLDSLAGESDSVSAQKPEGWESLEDASAASRLYYQFVDSNGRVRFVERMDDVPEQWRANVGFVKMAVPPPLSPGDAARARKTTLAGGRAKASAATSDKEVILYSAEWCGACKKAKRYLDRSDIDFVERDVDIPHNADELVQKTGQRSIPVIDVDGRVFTGFDRNAYANLL